MFKKTLEWSIRASVPALLSLLVGMINTYHSQSVIDRKELLNAVNSSTIANARQDQSIKDLAEIIQSLRQEKNQPLH